MLVTWSINIKLYIHSKFSYESILSSNKLRYLISFVFVLLFLFIFQSIGIQFRGDEKFGNFDLYPYLIIIGNNVFILVLMNLVVNQEESSKLKLDKAQLEINNLFTKHEQLKQQVHPHFLFNCMSNLKWLIKKDKNKASDYTDLLAAFLRKSLNMAETDQILLKEEIEFLEEYLELQKVRFQESLRVNISVPSALKTKAKIPVFALQILAENAIKHNGHSAENTLVIEIVTDDNSIVISNNKIEKIDTLSPSHGIGLKNLNERCKLLTQQEIVIDETETNFKVSLPILL